MVDAWRQDVRVRAPTAAPQPALHPDRGALARGRHRRQRGDLLGRERVPPQAAARHRQRRPPGGHRADAGRPRVRHLLVFELSGRAGTERHALGRLRDARRAAADEPGPRPRHRTDLRGRSERQLFSRAWNSRRARTHARRRRRPGRRRSQSWSSVTSCGHGDSVRASTPSAGWSSSTGATSPSSALRRQGFRAPRCCGRMSGCH